MEAPFTVNHWRFSLLHSIYLFLQAMFQEYMGRSEAFLSTSMEQGLVEMLPVVSAALWRVV